MTAATLEVLPEAMEQLLADVDDLLGAADAAAERDARRRLERTAARVAPIAVAAGVPVRDARRDAQDAAALEKASTATKAQHRRRAKAKTA